MKKYSLMIEADSAQELAQALSEAHMELGGSQQIAMPAAVLSIRPPQVDLAPPPPVPPAGIAPEEKAAPAPKKEKAKKAKEVEAPVEEKSVISASALKAEKAAPDPFGEQEAPVTVTAVTFDDVKNGLKKLIEKFDIDTAVSFLDTGWKISKITALKEADYEGFMAALEAKLKA